MEAGSAPRACEPAEAILERRVVLLGASNLVRSLPMVMDAARWAWGGPLDVLAAIGHGRSYGRDSRVLGRVLPGITECGLWEPLHARSAAPTAALITDVGNDILYGATPDVIAQWVETCCQRLREVPAKIVVTELPIKSLGKLGAARFVLMRTLLFPKSRLTLGRALADARELNQRVCELAERYEARLVRPDDAWFGFDPIHIRRRSKRAAWRALLGPWNEIRRSDAHVRLTARDRWVLNRLRPERRCLFGFEQTRAQPSGRLEDGSTLSIF